MGRFDVQWLRLALVTGAIAGSALVSSAVVATDEGSPIDESGPVVPANVIEMTPTDPPVTEPLITDPSPTDPLGTDPVPGESIVVEGPADPLDDIATIEIVVSEPGSGAAPVAEVVSSEPAGEMTSAPVAAPLGHDGVDTTDGGGHEGGDGGSGGEGNPYRMTFEVVWLDPDGTPIAILDGVLPDEWRSLFELSADSQTGRNRSTSATCTYPAGRAVLRCVFDNPGHGSGSDGLIIPARPTATYTVAVTWPPTDWTIDGANDGPHVARSLCPRGGGGGHDGEDGDETEGGHEGDGGDRSSFACVHTVVMRQAAIIVPPTHPAVVDPEPESAPTAPVVVDAGDSSTASDTAFASSPVAAAPVAAAPIAAATPRALPATGNSVSMLLVLAGLLVGIGSTVTVLSRRTS